MTTVQVEKTVTDKDMYEYISKSLLKQNMKSMDYYEDEDGLIDEGSGCKYFSTHPQISGTLHCAVGFTISATIYDENYEETGVLDPNVLGMVANSNPNWTLTTKSVSMLNILQNVHDSTDPEDWGKMLDFYQQYFNEDGSFNLFDQAEPTEIDLEPIFVNKFGDIDDESNPITCLKYDFIRNKFNSDRMKILWQ